MNWLYQKLQPVFRKWWYRKLTPIIVLLNPIAFIPQTYNVVTGNAKGVSIEMFLLFIALQITFTFIGIEQKDGRIFWSNALALVQAMFIVFVLATS